MPALPWTTISPPDRAREYVVMASRLPLARYRDMPGFLRAAMLIWAQLARASGLIGYTLDAHLARKTFWTVSAWDSRDALDAFSRADPHRSRVRVIRPGCGPPRSRTGPRPARTCPSPGPRSGAGSPPRSAPKIYCDWPLVHLCQAPDG
jgi:hypothetical protein